MSGEMQDYYVERLEKTLKNLIDKSKPFMSADNVDETSGTSPSMDNLASAIISAEQTLNVGS